MFIKHLETEHAVFEVYKIYLEGDHYVVIGAWVNTRFAICGKIADDTIYIPDELLHNWIKTDVEEYEDLKGCLWTPLKGRI